MSYEMSNYEGLVPSNDETTPATLEALATAILGSYDGVHTLSGTQIDYEEQDSRPPSLCVKIAT